MKPSTKILAGGGVLELVFGGFCLLSIFGLKVTVIGEGKLFRILFGDCDATVLAESLSSFLMMTGRERVSEAGFNN